MSATVMAVMLAGDEEEGAHLVVGPSVDAGCWAMGTRGFVLLVAEKQHVCLLLSLACLWLRASMGCVEDQVQR